MSNVAIEELLKIKGVLEAERTKSYDGFTNQIKEIEIAIELLSGKKIEEIEKEFQYDDESPDYIKQSIEEI